MAATDDTTAKAFYRDRWDRDVDCLLLSLTEGKVGLYDDRGKDVTDEMLDNLYAQDLTAEQAARDILAQLEEKGKGNAKG